ncbi:hydantoinase/oxoprolinase family protein [Metallosphaera tengchongensis]|uniref:Hydantoinase/oxoprolinase family protein n=1 Tax=Metallosphaera tengchongensis TaxID=1532350 RepID=A0A6N0NWN9_9CREN|nr:hydantoinase/oxoprolinase family protein [Metallosphaera tengchongensis]QKR00637.1 hydantoinase/oxoprolinase family protein [Metallosphaera tengchongensis]
MLTVSVDVGGTFTDIVGVDERGNFFTYKGPTTPENPEVGVIQGLASFKGVRYLVHATTLATNAILGQMRLNLPKVALLTTKGFRDVIEIGRQTRPELYNLFFRKPVPLVPRDMRFEIEERISASGDVLTPMSELTVEEGLKAAKERGASVIAISFLHSYLNPSHERRAKEISLKYFQYVSTSYEVCPIPREYERTSTTVLNSLLMPVIRRYLTSLEEGLRQFGNPTIYVMASSGGLIDVNETVERPVQIIESGPAAGIIGTSILSRIMGIPNSIGFDMGGTTAKAGTIFDYRVEVTQDYEVGGRTHHGRLVKGTGYPVKFPFVDLAEVSAGGGTVIWRDEGGGLRVGPLSSGADPGPMCYGKGGDRPTLTDANLVLGRIPDVISGDLKLDPNLSLRGLRELGDPVEVSVESVSLATLEMARAIRLVTVERGHDPSGFTLFAFGGAGPQFAVDLAEEIGITRVVIPPFPGLFSALGMLFADRKFEASMSYPKDLERGFEELERNLKSKHPDASNFLRYAEVRYEGQGWELTIPVNDPEKVEEEFQRVHNSVYGFVMDRPIEVVTIRSFAISPGLPLSLPSPPRSGTPEVKWREAFLENWVNVRVMKREQLPVGYVVEGPAILEEYSSTVIVKDGWKARVHETGSLILEEE